MGVPRPQGFKDLGRPREPDLYDADADWGSHKATNTREAMGRREPRLETITGAPIPCRLCEPGYVCHLCRED